jgi:hypothetical protein
MNLMKVSHMMKNMMNKEFQHFVEAPLIEVRKMKIHMIQFVSILNSIQPKLIKASRCCCKNRFKPNCSEFVAARKIEDQKSDEEEDARLEPRQPRAAVAPALKFPR